MKRFLISPPFGNWISRKDCTRILGSFTLNKRRGLVYHTLRSFRPVEGGWINQIGLRNRGIPSVQFNSENIYSLVGLEDGDWEEMFEYPPPASTLELNLGCPNVHRYSISFITLLNYCLRFNVIAKLPPTDAVYDMASMCMEAGVQYLHCSNTLPSPNGGISGAQLLRVNLPIVERLASEYPGKIIAGGGIYSPEVVRQYARLGAKNFSISTAWMKPWRVNSILLEGSLILR